MKPLFNSTELGVKGIDNCTTLNSKLAVGKIYESSEKVIDFSPILPVSKVLPSR
jgi:hypothetical protein